MGDTPDPPHCAHSCRWVRTQSTLDSSGFEPRGARPPPRGYVCDRDNSHDLASYQPACHRGGYLGGCLSVSGRFARQPVCDALLAERHNKLRARQSSFGREVAPHGCHGIAQRMAIIRPQHSLSIRGCRESLFFSRSPGTGSPVIVIPRSGYDSGDQAARNLVCG